MLPQNNVNKDLPLKVVFVIGSMAGGGAEKVMLQILHYLDRKKFNPHLVLFRKTGVFLDSVPPDVQVHSLVDNRYNIYRWLMYFRYKKCISKLKPGAVVSFMWYPNFIVLLERCFNRSRYKIIVSERSTLTFTYEGRLVGYIRKWFLRYLYHKADSVIAQTQQMKKELMEIGSLKHEKIKVINNPLDIKVLEEYSKDSLHASSLNLSSPLVLSMGRLTIQKGFKYLITAFASVIKSHQAQLMILGEGKERSSLQRLIKQLGVKENIYMPGFEINPYKYLAKATIFVLSSISEGFPNVLIEAMAIGIPCIATRCPTGPEEIITDGVDGILIPPADELAMANAIKRVLTDESLRKRLGEAGKKRVEDFRIEKIIKQYEDIIDEAFASSVI